MKEQYKTANETITNKILQIKAVVNRKNPSSLIREHESKKIINKLIRVYYSWQEGINEKGIDKIKINLIMGRYEFIRFNRYFYKDKIIIETVAKHYEEFSRMDFLIWKPKQE